MGIIESAAAIVTGIKELASSFTLKKSILWIFIIIFLLFLLLYTFEIFTGHFYFARINKKIDILTKIDKQIPQGSPLKREIYNQYKLLAKNISQYKVSKRISLPKTMAVKLTKKNIQNILKFLTAWIIPLLLIIFQTKRRSPKGKSDLIVGSIIIGIVCGGIAVLIPIIYNPWINYLGVPIIQALTLAIIGIVTKK